MDLEMEAAAAEVEVEMKMDPLSAATPVGAGGHVLL